MSASTLRVTTVPRALDFPENNQSRMPPSLSHETLLGTPSSGAKLSSLSIEPYVYPQHGLSLTIDNDTAAHLRAVLECFGSELHC